MRLRRSSPARARIEDAAVTPIQATDKESVENERQGKTCDDGNSDRGEAVFDAENIGNFTADR